ncbi:cell division protein FtsL [Gephyromycinifex aptenodytis]|uniref:cell division protein FtsL n=1 Tax=Gephyromycinifex aptenodytis TaxID=2716227 RepID=UPI0014457DF8|nr:cell division protein FtsL [Gephyromycinifex aptenodytis]
MSQMPVATTVRPARRPAPARPDLRVVSPAPLAPRRLPFVLLCSFVLAAGLFALLMINMQLASGTYALHDLQQRSIALAQDEQKLRETLAVQESPAVLAQRAEELGLVPGTAPVFLDVSDGSVAGEPTPAPTPTDNESAAPAPATPSSSVSGADTAG